jgi:predicted phosphodiesterase
MKYLIFGDMHGRNLSDLEKSLEDFSPDALICLGDFDRVSVIKQFIELEKRYLDKGKTVIKVPGNHDNSIFLNDTIYSGALEKQGKTTEELYYELLKDSISHKYIEELLNPDKITKNLFLDENKLGKKYSSVVIHGAYAGDESSYFNLKNQPDHWKFFWNRLFGPYDFNKNFEIMKTKGEKIMIRGHDHMPTYVLNDPEKGLSGYRPDENSKYPLLTNFQHIINPGAFFEGNFAIINTEFPGEEFPVLTYHKV